MAEIISLSEKMVKVETQLDYMNDNLIDIKESVKVLNNTIQSMTIQNDSKYAAKRTETTVDAAIWIVVVAVIMAILALVFKRKQ